MLAVHGSNGSVGTYSRDSDSCSQRHAEQRELSDPDSPFTFREASRNGVVVYPNGDTKGSGEVSPEVKVCELGKSILIADNPRR
jgi:hypothetical protein